jgi:hypothetical protein
MSNRDVGKGKCARGAIVGVSSMRFVSLSIRARTRAVLGRTLVVVVVVVVVVVDDVVDTLGVLATVPARVVVCSPVGGTASPKRHTNDLATGAAIVLADVVATAALSSNA